MWVTSSTLRRHWLELASAAFAAANVVVIVALEHYPTVPFHFVWVSLTLLYGYRVWALRTTAGIVVAVSLATAVAIAWAARGSGHWDELAEVPLMAAMVGAMVVHARRGKAAHAQLEAVLERHADFVRDASHELRTPITVARGHAELIRIGSADLQVRGTSTSCRRARPAPEDRRQSPYAGGIKPLGVPASRAGRRLAARRRHVAPLARDRGTTLVRPNGRRRRVAR